METYTVEELDEGQLQNMHKIIMKQDVDDHSFQFCLDTIQNTLLYVNEARKEKKMKSIR